MEEGVVWEQEGQVGRGRRDGIKEGMSERQLELKGICTRFGT